MSTPSGQRRQCEDILRLFISSTYGRSESPDLHVLGEGREHPHAAAAIEAPRRLEVQLTAEQLVDELERLLVQDDPVPLPHQARRPIRAPAPHAVQALPTRRARQDGTRR